MVKNTVSLDGLSVSDLTALQGQIDEQIKARREEAKQDMKKRILAELGAAGFSLADIFPTGRGTKPEAGIFKQKVRIKYSDGQNHWTGRGKMPLWIKSFVESGGKLASLEVAK